MRFIIPLTCTFLAILAIGAERAAGQAAFVETFDATGSVQAGQDGPSGLVSKGFVFRNQSEPTGAQSWFQGHLGSLYPQPHDGPGYLAVTSASTDFFGGRISNWMILPPINGQLAGDTLTLQLRSIASANLDAIQIRYSPNGGISTGTTALDSGDFSQVLLNVLPLSTTGWTTSNVTVPGPGRLAVRYFVDDACNFACASSYVALDSLTVGPPIGPGCNQPTMPVPGQTVTWTAAQGPYTLCQDQSIPAGATVNIEPGTTLHVDSGYTLFVEGQLNAIGQPSSPITFTAGSVFPEPIEVHGIAHWRHALIRGTVMADLGGTLIVEESQIDGATIGALPTLWPEDEEFVSVSGCSFTNDAEIAVTDGTLAVRDSTFQGGGVRVSRGYLLLDGVFIDQGAMDIHRQRYTNPAVLDSLGITNFVSPFAALRLAGGNFEIPPGTLLSGNQTPVSLIGGLVPGSQVPAVGNVFNHIELQGGGGILTPAGAPYAVLDDIYLSGAIFPGTELRLGLDASIQSNGSASFRALGDPDAPIRFRPLTIGQRWQGIFFFFHGGPLKFDHCEVEGGNFGVLSDETFLEVDGSRFIDCTTAAATATFGTLRARGTEFVNNATAVKGSGISLDGKDGVNSFVGNQLAINGSGSINAERGWWGDPSGPAHTSNPGGAGDPVAGVGVDLLPFETSPPGNDAQPIVRMNPHSWLMETGQKVILRWNAKDDGDIVSQRLLFSPHGTTLFQPVATLSADARSHEFLVPVAPPSSINEASVIRIEAIDDAGQMGYDEYHTFIPYTQDISGDLTFQVTPTGAYTCGDLEDVCFTTSTPATVSAKIVLDSDLGSVSLGGIATGCLPIGARMPHVSTDNARIALTMNLGAGGRQLVFFTDPFTIRPDARIADAPPSIAMTHPTPGQVYPGGSVVPITWSAADDGALRAIHIHASYDGGRTWHVVEKDLPGTTTSYGWHLPASSGIQDVRLRVIAVDHLFQNTSSGAGLPFSISAGTDGLCQADLGFGGPGNAKLTVCGQPLSAGGHAVLQLDGAAPNAASLLAVGLSAQPTPLLGGVFVPVPVATVLPMVTDPSGRVFLPGIPGGVGPISVYAQFLISDPNESLGLSISNAVRIDFLP